MKFVSPFIITISFLLYGSWNGLADQQKQPTNIFSDTSIDSIKLVNTAPDKKYALFCTSNNNIKSVKINDKIGKEGFELKEIYSDRIVLVQRKSVLISKTIVIQFDSVHPWEQNRFTYYSNGNGVFQKTYVIPGSTMGKVKGNNIFSNMKGSSMGK